MGLRCSVLGHRYGERDRIEERDERGDEIVVAIREVKTCERCGDELVVSESKEIRAVDFADPTESESIPVEEDATADPITIEETVEEYDDPETDDAVILPNKRSTSQDEPTESESPESAPTPPDMDQLPVTDDEEESWPDVDAEDEGFDAVDHDRDEEISDRIIEAVNTTSTEPDGEETAAGFHRAQPINDPSTPSDTDVHTEYYCPRCDWQGKSLVTSVRRGDICPSCRRGYVAEREIS